MSNELNYKSGITGQTITAKTQLLGTTTLSTAISCQEIGTTGEYSGDMAGSSGRYSVSFYASGSLVDSGQIDWDGTAEITGVSINTQIGTRAATADSRFAFLDASIAARPTNPLLTNDVRLDNIDAAISSRLPASSYTAPPTAAAVSAQVWSETTRALTDKAGFNVTSLGAGTVTATSIAATALNGKGDWNIGKAGYNVSTIDAGVITPIVAPNLDATVSSRATVNADNTTIGRIALSTDSIESRLPTMLIGGKMDATATDISSLATAAALSSVSSAVNTINLNTDSVEASLTTITAALPTAGAKIAGEGATIKNLEQLPTASGIVAGIFAFVVEETLTFKDFLRIGFAVLAGKTIGVGTSQNEFKGVGGVITRLRTTFDIAKNRLTVFLYGGD